MRLRAGREHPFDRSSWGGARHAHSYGPTLTDLLTVSTAGGTAICGTIGLLLRPRDLQQALSNLVSGVTVGAFAGALIGFAVYAAEKVA